MKWRNFDHWWVKLVAFLIILGSVAWMGYAIWWHYDREHTCSCLEHWEYLPFVAGGLFLLFAMAILSKKATEGAANVVLPFATLVLERLGRRSSDPVVPVSISTTPVTHTEDTGDKP